MNTTDQRFSCYGTLGNTMREHMTKEEIKKLDSTIRNAKHTHMTHTTMKSRIILTLLILGSALLHVGPITLVALLAGAFIPLTHTSVALVLLGLTLNTLALVQLHRWNGSFN